MDLGIQADIIVMHPYDRWGFSEMSAECDDLYWKYLIARVSAYRNVWWSLANEYDLSRKRQQRTGSVTHPSSRRRMYTTIFVLFITARASMIIQDHGLHTAAFRDRIFTNPPKW